MLALTTISARAAESSIPGLEFLQIPADASIGQLLSQLYIWGIGFVALAAFLMFTWGGVLYMIAGDKDPTSAKSYMKNAIYGLLLALGSYLILYTINPALVNIPELKLPEINQAAMPTPTGASYTCSQNNQSYASLNECNGVCGPLGGTCSNPTATGFCATISTTVVCPPSASNTCPSGGVFIPSTWDRNADLQRCINCTQRLRQGQSC